MSYRDFILAFAFYAHFARGSGEEGEGSGEGAEEVVTAYNCNAATEDLYS